MTRNLYLAGEGWTGRRVFTVSLGVVLFIDALFFSAHVLRAYLNETSYHGFLLDRGWSLELDRSYPEQFQYLLSGLSAVVLGVLYARRRSLTYLGWSLAFLFILVDDSFSLHEHFTRMLEVATSSATFLGLETRVYAASVLWGLVGLVLLSILAVGYRRDPATQKFSRRLAYVLAVLFFFGGVVDALHLVAGEDHLGRATKFFLGTLEDGGELVSISVGLALVLAHASTHFALTKPAERR